MPPPRDLSPSVIAAGRTEKVVSDVSQCFTTARAPPTPDYLKPYRKSHTMAVGAHHPMSPARARDPQLPADKVYGATNDYSDSAAKCLTSPTKVDPNARPHRYQSEKLEPLGQKREYNWKLPESAENATFGKKTNKSESAKNVMYPPGKQEGSPVKEAGYQAQRGYNWNVNPAQTRFGRAGKPADGAHLLEQPMETTIVPSPTKAARELQHAPLGKTLVAGMAPPIDKTMTFGKTQKVDKTKDSASYILHGGDAPPKDDPTLGTFSYKSPMLRKAKEQDRAQRGEEDRTFGVPSVRSDKPTPDPHRTKVTSGTGYAGDANAGDLLYAGDAAVVAKKGLSLDECIALSERCQFGLSRSQIQTAYQKATTRKGPVTAYAFSQAVTDCGFD